jgi:hypothetical protein
MSDIQILDEMVSQNAKLAVETANGKNKVVLIEPQDNLSVTLSGLPDNAIILKADAFKSPDTIFNGTKGECKRADFVIVANIGKKKVIVCIEMKATKDSRKEIVQQLTGAQCLARYCQEIGRQFWQQRDFLEGYVYRFVSIGHISIAKQKTRISRQAPIHDHPDKMLKIDWPHHLEFNHLAGKI